MCSLLLFHVIVFSLLGVVEALLRKTSVTVWTHLSALETDRIPCVEMGSVNSQGQDSIARSTQALTEAVFVDMKAGKR